MAGSMFEIIRCDLCGMKGTHIQCSGIDKSRPEFTCDDHGDEYSDEEEDDPQDDADRVETPTGNNKKKRQLSSGNLLHILLHDTFSSQDFLKIFQIPIRKTIQILKPCSWTMKMPLAAAARLLKNLDNPLRLTWAVRLKSN